MQNIRPHQSAAWQPPNTGGSSSIVDGKIAKATYAEPRNKISSNARKFSGKAVGSSWVDDDDDDNHHVERSTLPSNVRGQSSSNTGYANWPATQLTKAANLTAWSQIASGAKATPDVRSISSVNPSTRKQSSRASGPPGRSSNLSQGHVLSTGTSIQPVTSQNSEKVPPPHLRGPSSVSSSKASQPTPAKNNIKAPTSSFQQLHDAQTEAEPVPKSNNKPTLKMNADKGAKSAKFDSKFPCPYKECTMGFAKERDLFRHKDDEHDWCRLCKEDFDDDAALLEHKKASERHICCPECGEDFRSEAGRDRHLKQMHAPKQEVKCAGCGLIFDKGAALINHIYNNQCKDKEGQVQEKVNQERLREFRAVAALHMDELSHQSERPVFEDQFTSLAGTVIEDSVGGGVPINYLEMDEDYPALGASSMATSKAKSNEGWNASTTPARTTNDPAVAEVIAKGKQLEEPVIQGLDALRVTSPTRSSPSKPICNKKLFPNAKPTPVSAEWTPPILDHRSSVVPSESGTEQWIRTDWDHWKFERSGVDQMFHCPFVNCNACYIEVAGLKAHLVSGFHQGTDHRCVKCLKIFKTPAALVAHMESSGERCRVKDTRQFGQILHVISGGFLGVSGRHEDGTVQISATDLDEWGNTPTLLPQDDPNYLW